MDLNGPMGGATNNINFDLGAAGGTIGLNTRLPNIEKNVSINGPSQFTLTVQPNPGAGDFRLFLIATGRTVTISGLTLFGGNEPTGNGGGILNRGILTLDAVTVYANQAIRGAGIYNDVGATLTLNNVYVISNRANKTPEGDFGDGGGVYNQVDGTVTIRARTEFTENYAENNGGGLYNLDRGRLVIDMSTFHLNRSARNGGGIWNESRTLVNPVVITATTFSRNEAEGNGLGGAIFNRGIADIANSTFSKNSAKDGGQIYRAEGGHFFLKNVTGAEGNARGGGGNPGRGGGMFLEPGGTLTIVNTIFSGNVADFGPDVFGVVSEGESLGHNLIGNSSDSFGWVGTDLLNIDPSLSPLGDYGGPTKTYLLLPGSRALDAGNDKYAPLPYDQRGEGYLRIVGVAVDIGAVEMQPGAIDALFARGLTPIPKSRRRR